MAQNYAPSRPAASGDFHLGHLRPCDRDMARKIRGGFGAQMGACGGHLIASRLRKWNRQQNEKQKGHTTSEPYELVFIFEASRSAFTHHRLLDLLCALWIR